MTIDVLFAAILAASFLGVFQLGRLVERDRWKGSTQMGGSPR